MLPGAKLAGSKTIHDENLGHLEVRIIFPPSNSIVLVIRFEIGVV